MEQVIYDAAQDGAGDWELVSDRVMGGVSDGALTLQEIAGRPALRLTGTVSTDNDGGFLQLARNAQGAGGWTGMVLDLAGNDTSYNLHLRTDVLNRPWQSFRTSFAITREWQSHSIAFDDLVAHRTDAAFDPDRLVRIGIVGIGRDFQADIAVARLALYR